MPFDPDLRIRSGAYLPHWEKEGGIYAVRFRLHDSLPQGKLKELEEERKKIIESSRHPGKTITKAERERIDYLFSQKIERYLDSGYGSCWLERDDIAEIVANSLRYFDNDRYQLFAWCIMPNHVHVVLQTITHSLRDIMYSCKKYTAIEANKILCRKGTFWQSESFDHLTRNQESLERWVEYTWNNPDVAGLKNWKWRWRADK